MLKRRTLLRGALSAPVVSARANALGPQSAAGEDTGPATGPKGPSSEAIRAVLENQIDPGRLSLGYVAGIIDGDGRRLITVGQSNAPDGRALDGGSVFEIGSITKVFTALLLADMVQRGEVALDDPVAKYLPPEGRPRAFPFVRLPYSRSFQHGLSCRFWAPNEALQPPFSGRRISPVFL